MPNPTEAELWDLLRQAVDGCSYCPPFPEAEAALAQLQEQYSGECVWKPERGIRVPGCPDWQDKGGWQHCPYCGKCIREAQGEKHRPAGQHDNFFDWWRDWGNDGYLAYVKELCLEAWEDGKKGAYRMMDEEAANRRAGEEQNETTNAK